MQEEVWLPVEGYEGQYEVSSKGNVRRLERMIPTRGGALRKIPILQMKVHTMRNGYSQLLFKRGNANFHQLVHRLVAKAFIPNPENLPQVNHKDGNKPNNCVENLEWISPRENCLHARRENLYEVPRGEGHANSRLTTEKVIEIRAKAANGQTHESLSKEFDIARSAITRVVNRNSWKHV